MLRLGRIGKLLKRFDGFSAAGSLRVGQLMATFVLVAHWLGLAPLFKRALVARQLPGRIAVHRITHYKSEGDQAGGAWWGEHFSGRADGVRWDPAKLPHILIILAI